MIKVRLRLSFNVGSQLAGFTCNVTEVPSDRRYRKSLKTVVRVAHVMFFPALI